MSGIICDRVAAAYMSCFPGWEDLEKVPLDDGRVLARPRTTHSRAHNPRPKKEKAAAAPKDRGGRISKL